MKKQTHTVDFSKGRKTRRYLVADRTEATIYRQGRLGQFIFVHRLTNPEGNTKEVELDSDRPGRCVSTGGGGTIHHALDRRTHTHEESAKMFAREICQFLKQSNKEEEFDELVLAAEPHFLGLLRAAMPQSLRKLVKLEIPREYTQGPNKNVKNLILKAAKRLQEENSRKIA